MCSKTARTAQSTSFTAKADLEAALLGFGQRQQNDEQASPVSFEVGFSPGSIRVSRSSSERRGKKSENWQPRKASLAWSDKSRAQMLERFTTLDFSPFQDDSSILAFLTLTYPSKWQVVAPTSTSAKRHLLALRKRFERQFNRPFFALWKMEFQRRGAPHFHLLTTDTERGRFYKLVEQKLG